MRCISLWQPWASLCVAPDPKTLNLSNGNVRWVAKDFETRPWKTSYRGPLLIHAAKKWTRDMMEMCQDEDWWFYPELAKRGLASKTTFHSAPSIYLPFGAIIGQVTLDAIYPTERIRETADEMQLAFGDYSDGRFAWKFINPVQFATPIPYRGQQGLFNVPDALLREVQA